MKHPRYAIEAAIVGGVIAVSSVIGVTFAQTGGTATPTPSATTPQQQGDKQQAMNDFLAKFAANLGVSVDQVKAAATKTANDQIDAEVAAGRLTAEQAAQLKQRIASGNGFFFFGGGHPGLGGPGGPGRGHEGRVGKPAGGVFAAAATAIGIDEQTLMTELRSGKSLAQVAEAHGKTRDALKAALTQQYGQSLDQLLDRTFPGMPGRGPRPQGTPSATPSS